MEQKLYGYIRVSTREQNEDRQVRAMEDFGVLPANMICDKQSGKDFERPGYKRLVKKIKPGDTLIILGDDKRGLAIPTRSLINGLAESVFESEKEEDEK